MNMKLERHRSHLAQLAGQSATMLMMVMTDFLIQKIEVLGSSDDTHKFPDDNVNVENMEISHYIVKPVTVELCIH